MSLIEGIDDVDDMAFDTTGDTDAIGAIIGTIRGNKSDDRRNIVNFTQLRSYGNRETLTISSPSLQNRCTYTGDYCNL